MPLPLLKPMRLLRTVPPSAPAERRLSPAEVAAPVVKVAALAARPRKFCSTSAFVKLLPIRMFAFVSVLGVAPKPRTAARRTVALAAWRSSPTATAEVPSTSSSGRATCESAREPTPTAPPAPSEPVLVSRNEVPFELL
jgi:hypothetical protein